MGVMIDDVLYVIGNGFDIHHGVWSRYSDFANFLKINNYSLYDKFTTICHVDFLWSEFERALAYVNRDYFLGIGEVMMPYDWAEDKSYSELFLPADYVRGEAECFWKEVQKWFRKWTRQIRWFDKYNSKKIRIDDYARFITFNYTPFLETVYGIPAENILYMHGKAINKHNLPIIGHDGSDTFELWSKSNPKGYKRYYTSARSVLPEEEMMTEAVEEYFDLSRKPVADILKKNESFINDLYDIRTIIILGHSLGDVDMPYFKAIHAANDNPTQIKWYMSYYGDLEKDVLEKKLRSNVVGDEATITMFKIEDWQMRKNL